MLTLFSGYPSSGDEINQSSARNSIILPDEISILPGFNDDDSGIRSLELWLAGEQSILMSATVTKWSRPHGIAIVTLPQSAATKLSLAFWHF